MPKTSKAKEFQEGDVVFTADGRKAEFITSTDNGFVVNQCYQVESWEGEVTEYFNDIRVVEKVFPKPPVEVFDATVKALQQQISERREELAYVITETRDAEKSRKELLAKLNQNDALRGIEDFLDGKITHFVTRQYSCVRIQEKDKALKASDYRDTHQKLLTLFGSTKGDLLWRIHEYATDSGSSMEVWPCRSLEDAQAKVQQMFKEFIEEFRAAENKPHVDDWIKSAKTLGFEIPTDLAEHQKVTLCATIGRNIASTEKTLADLKAALAAV